MASYKPGFIMGPVYLTIGITQQLVETSRIEFQLNPLSGKLHLYV
jgi:hypothetical protein